MLFHVILTREMLTLKIINNKYFMKMSVFNVLKIEIFNFLKK